MPENPKPRIQIFRPGAYDRYLVEGARELIEFAKKLAESDQSVLFRWHKPPQPMTIRTHASDWARVFDDPTAPTA
jgi:hypothetical protein